VAQGSVVTPLRWDQWLIQGGTARDHWCTRQIRDYPFAAHRDTERTIGQLQSRSRERIPVTQTCRRSIAPERSCLTTAEAERDSVIPPTP